MDVESAKEELLKGSGTQFDPKILKVFLGLLEDGTIERIRNQSIA